MRQDAPAKALPRVWTFLFVVVLGIVLLVVFLLLLLGRGPGGGGAGDMAVVEDAAAGTLTVMDGGRPVLAYRFGDQLPAGVDPRYARSSYIHPLYSLDGEPLTEDFPGDHRHHHGLFWAWPVVEVRGVRTSNWEPGEPPLRQRFVKVITTAVSGAGARFVVKNVWRLGDTEHVAEETVTIAARPATPQGRAIDVEIALRPVGGDMALRGASADNKGYSGLCFRGGIADGQGRDAFKGARMTTDEGPLEADSTGRPFRWADLSTPALGGVAVFVPPDHPGSPLPWLVRNSYAGILNPCWPGLAGATLTEDAPVTLRYRIYVHRGDAAAGGVREAYEAYIAGGKRP
jgi:hypothetical protein